MKIEYHCVCGSHMIVTRGDRRPISELVEMWRQHAQCPAIWARWGKIDSTEDTVETPVSQEVE